MGFLRKVLRICIDAAIVLAIVCLVPGGYPKGDFEYIEIKPPLPREGPLAPNSILDKGVRLFEGKFSAPECIAHRGNKNEIFVSMHGGSIVKVYGENYSQFNEVAKIGPGCRGFWDEKTCGRPLGMRFSKDGTLIVADSYLGIFKVNVDTGVVDRLFDPSLPINGAVPLLIDDVDEDSAGNIYWSDASSLYSLYEGLLEGLAGPSGRLVMLSPSGQNTVLVDKLHFANGVQLSPKQDFVLVCETYQHRVLRYWLSGPKAGTHDIFIDGLPGNPDNLRSKPGGGYYINLVVVNDPNLPNLSHMLGRSPYLRRGLARILYFTKLIIDAVANFTDNYFCNLVSYRFLNTGSLSGIVSGNRSMVVITDEEGKIVSTLQGESGTLRFIAHTEEVDDRLFFGSPYSPYLGMVPLDTVAKYQQEPRKQTASKKKEEL